MNDSPLCLSICIATFNRCNYIVHTLSSIVNQMMAGMELVIVDGASKDETEAVVGRFMASHPEVLIRYFREEKNSGVDADYDKAVCYANGRYCWLMTDDDVLVDGAMERICKALLSAPDLLVLNAEIRDVKCERILDASMIKMGSDRRYSINDRDELISDLGHCLSFIGSVVINRDIWMSREREQFYGTAFVHVGVIFELPRISDVVVITSPMIAIRYGNAMWTARGFEIWNFKWPDLIWATKGVSDAAKARVCAREPWRNVKQLVLARALGSYSVVQYVQFLRARTTGLTRLVTYLVSILPMRFVNVLVSLYLMALKPDARMAMYDLSRARSSTWITRYVARVIGVSS